MRKDAGFEVIDHIRVYCDENDKIKAIMERNADEIKSEVLADFMEFSTPKGYIKEWNINGEKVSFAVEKL